MDPGRGPGSESGKRVIWARGMSYARSLYPGLGRVARAAHRPRPRRPPLPRRELPPRRRGGRAARSGARRLPGRDRVSALGRPARRFALSLDRARFTPGPSRLSAEPPPGGPDAATKLRLALLDGREPIDASGELLLDAATGAPLSVRISALLGVKGDPDARVRVEVEGRLTALGGEVAAVEPPPGVLPDERKPRGVARALEQAGLRKKKGAEAGRRPDDRTRTPRPTTRSSRRRLVHPR